MGTAARRRVYRSFSEKHARPQLEEISARRLTGRGADVDTVPLDDVAHELKALIAAR